MEWKLHYGPFFGCPKYSVPYYNRDPKGDHKFDNHPYGGYSHRTSLSLWRGAAHGAALRGGLGLRGHVLGPAARRQGWGDVMLSLFLFLFLLL